MQHTAVDGLPGDLYGRRRRDRLVRTADTLARLYFRSLAYVPKRRHQLSVDARSHNVTVTRRSVEARDQQVVCLELGSAGPLPAWSAGAHVDVTLPSGRFRQYSLCGDPTDLSAYRIAVRLVPAGDGGSREVHDDIHVGTRLRISTPRNAFPFAVGTERFRPRHVRFVAGGIGITPILPMAAAAHRLGLDWSLVYLGRTAESLAFLDQLSPYGSRVRVRLDSEHGLPTAHDMFGDLPDGAEVYCCGPGPVLDKLRGYLRERGDIGFHYERFAPPPIIDGKNFQVEFASDGTVVNVPADRTALETVRAARPHVLYSCRQGFCGTCRVRVIEGAPTHHGIALSDEDKQTQMLLCVSRAESGRIVIDL